MLSKSVIKKLSFSEIDLLQAATVLKNKGKISEDDIVLMMDAIYLQKSNYYRAGNMVGANTNGELYRSVLVFIIIIIYNNNIEHRTIIKIPAHR